MLPNTDQRAAIGRAEATKGYNLVGPLFQKIKEKILPNQKLLTAGYMRENFEKSYIVPTVITATITPYVPINCYDKDEITEGTVVCDQAYEEFHARWNDLSQSPNDDVTDYTLWSHIKVYKSKKWLMKAKQIKLDLAKNEEEKKCEFTGYRYDHENDLIYYAATTLTESAPTEIADITIGIDLAVAVSNATQIDRLVYVFFFIFYYFQTQRPVTLHFGFCLFHIFSLFLFQTQK